MSDAIAWAFALWMMVCGLAFARLLGFVFVQSWSRNLMTLGPCLVSVEVSLMPLAEVTGIHGIRVVALGVHAGSDLQFSGSNEGVKNEGRLAKFSVSQLR